MPNERQKRRDNFPAQPYDLIEQQRDQRLAKAEADRIAKAEKQAEKQRQRVEKKLAWEKANAKAQRAKAIIAARIIPPALDETEETKSVTTPTEIAPYSHTGQSLFRPPQSNALLPSPAQQSPLLPSPVVERPARALLPTPAVPFLLPKPAVQSGNTGPAPFLLPSPGAVSETPRLPGAVQRKR